MYKIKIISLFLLGVVLITYGLADRIFLFGDNEYIFSYPNKKNWYSALRFCASINYKLVEIISDEINTDVIKILNDSFYRNVTSRSVWIGGTDLGSEGVYFWITSGDTINYSNFAENEPNNGVPVKKNESKIHDVLNTSTDINYSTSTYPSYTTEIYEYGERYPRFTEVYREFYSTSSTTSKPKIDGIVNEHCLELSHGFDFKFNDYICSVEQYFLCQRSIKQALCEGTLKFY